MVVPGSPFLSDETEIKLAVHPDGLASAIKLFAKDKPVEVYSTYFDTPQLLLRQHGVQLRLRRDGETLLQTVKLPDGTSGPMTRAEHEITLTSATLDIGHLMSVLPQVVAEAMDADLLEPVFVTRFERRRHLAGPDGVVELAFDRGAIERDDRQVPILEIEAELKGADFDAYIAEILALLDKVPAGLIASGKAARGYRLASGAAEVAVLSRKLELPSDIDLPEAIQLMMRHNFAHFFENITAASAGIPQGIHQIRVGLRRLRSTISAFKPVMDTSDVEAMLQGMKTLFNAFGTVREADVFIAETLPQLAAAGMTTQLTRSVVGHVEHFREKAQSEVTRLLGSTETARLVVQLYGWIESGRWLKDDAPLDKLLDKRPVGDFAGPRLRKLHKSLLKKGLKARNSVDLDDWHEARIAAKKLRYAADPMISTLDLPPEVALTYRRNVEAIQGELGRLNDLNVAEQFLEEVRESVPARQRQSLSKAIGILAEWQDGAADHFIAEAGRSFRTFEKNGFPLRKKWKR